MEKIIFTLLFWGFFFGGGFDLLMFYTSGWDKLVPLYKTDQPPPTKLLKQQSGQIGTGTLMRAINIGVSDEGLYLSMVSFSAISSMFNSPLMIPWNVIFRVKPNNDSSFGECYQMDIGTPTVTTLILPKQAFQEVETILATKR